MVLTLSGREEHQKLRIVALKKELFKGMVAGNQFQPKTAMLRTIYLLGFPFLNPWAFSGTYFPLMKIIYFDPSSPLFVF